jgi:signal transduction histidine kinase
VREHGGFITVRSVLGKGTTFAVHLPLDAEESCP